MAEILSLSQLSQEHSKVHLTQVEDIFFLSSSLKTFATPEKKAAFYKRWCGDYQSLYPEEFFILMEGKKALGYLSGCSDTLGGEKVLSVPGMNVFHDLYEQFPAHLHINFHPDARGRGLGSLLVNHYVQLLKQKQIKGVHLITSPEAPNVNFYFRLGFTHTFTRDHNGMALYFMGHNSE